MVVYDHNRGHPDPAKVNAIADMQAPTSVKETQEFMGIATYLGSFIPQISDLLAPLLELAKKDTTFILNVTI